VELTVQRKIFTTKSTIGELYIDGVFECYILEDTVRGPGVKVPGQTAIPAGTYEVVIDMSNHFKRMMPHLLDVPMFEGIRMHWGNKSEDTEGCLLMGKTEGKDFIGHSVEEFNQFFPKLEEGLKDGKVYITIG
jgi:hypothetical protein